MGQEYAKKIGKTQPPMPQQRTEIMLNNSYGPENYGTHPEGLVFQ
jgi:hypothetical protein